MPAAGEEILRISGGQLTAWHGQEPQERHKDCSKRYLNAILVAQSEATPGPLFVDGAARVELKPRCSSSCPTCVTSSRRRPWRATGARSSSPSRRRDMRRRRVPDLRGRHVEIGRGDCPRSGRASEASAPRSRRCARSACAWACVRDGVTARKFRLAPFSRARGNQIHDF